MTDRAKSLVAAIAIGVLAGASMTHALTVQERAQLALKTHELSLTARHWHNETLRLKEELGLINKKSQTGGFIQSVDVRVIKSPISTVDVQSALEPYTSSLLGLPLTHLKVYMLYHLFDSRIIEVGSKLYRINVKAILLSPTAYLLISVTPVNEAHTN